MAYILEFSDPDGHCCSDCSHRDDACDPCEEPTCEPTTFLVTVTGVTSCPAYSEVNFNKVYEFVLNTEISTPGISCYYECAYDGQTMGYGNIYGGNFAVVTISAGGWGFIDFSCILDGVGSNNIYTECDEDASYVGGTGGSATAASAP